MLLLKDPVESAEIAHFKRLTCHRIGKENSTQNGVQSGPGDRDMGSVLEGREVSTDRRALEPVLGALNVLP